MFHGSHYLALFGSGEFEPWAEPVDRFLLERADGDGSVLIVPTASFPDDNVGASFERWGRRGLEHYARLGVPARVAELRRPDDAFRSDTIDFAERASLIFLSGGNAAYLATVLRDSPFWGAVRRALARGAAVAGCSAGSCVLGVRAPFSVTADLDQDDVWVPALGYFPRTIVAPHWDALDVHNPGLTTVLRSRFTAYDVVGIDERTALVLADGEEFVVGHGSARLIRDGIEMPLGVRVEERRQAV